MKKPPKMKHLEGALRLEPKGAPGMCFHRSVGLVLDMPAATLVVAIMPPADEELRLAHPNVDFSPEEFLHCWAEIGDFVVPPSSITAQGSLTLVPKADYYEVHHPTDIRRMSRARLKHLSTEYDLDKHLLHFAPVQHGAKFGDVILDALEVPWAISDRGGVVPLR